MPRSRQLIPFPSLFIIPRDASSFRRISLLRFRSHSPSSSASTRGYVFVISWRKKKQAAVLSLGVFCVSDTLSHKPCFSSRSYIYFLLSSNAGKQSGNRRNCGLSLSLSLSLLMGSLYSCVQVCFACPSIQRSRDTMRFCNAALTLCNRRKRFPHFRKFANIFRNVHATQF